LEIVEVAFKVEQVAVSYKLLKPLCNLLHRIIVAIQDAAKVFFKPVWEYLVHAFCIDADRTGPTLTEISHFGSVWPEAAALKVQTYPRPK
jgi:hypothetical protein